MRIEINEKDIIEYQGLHHCNYNIAKKSLELLLKGGKTAELMKKYNCPFPTARYISRRQLKGFSYHPRSMDNGLSYEIVNNYLLAKDNKSLYGWKVFYKSIDYPVNIFTIEKHCYVKRYIGYRKISNKIVQDYEQFPLTSLIYCKLKQLPSLPKGIIIDHIDNNPLNNDLKNLSCTTRSLNSSKDHQVQNTIHYDNGAVIKLKPAKNTPIRMKAKHVNDSGSIYLAKFKSVREACDDTGLSRDCILNSLNNGYTYHGWTFYYDKA